MNLRALTGTHSRLLSCAIAACTFTGLAALPADADARPQSQAVTEASTAVSGGGPALKQLRYDLTLYSFDGTPIAITVFQPALAKDQPAPLVLYSHGWGGSRSTDLAGDDFINATARKLWESGYYVVTFDQRGFGDSGGEANVQDPDLEGRDVQTILDWAEGALTPHLAYSKGDPLVGALGLSYGGGFQLVGAGMDPRFDALVPVITWNHLPYSLAPEGVPKTLWLNLLAGSGFATGTMPQWLTQSFLESTSGNVSDATVTRLGGHGLGAFCAGTRADGRGTPAVDAFFIQGVNDTLFNTNEAAWNYNCLRQAGNDVYLTVTSGGHTIPGLQAGTLGAIQPQVRCGEQTHDLGDLAYGFFDGKLRQLKPEIAMPRVCIAQDEQHGLIAEQVPVGGRAFSMDSGKVWVGPPSVDLVLDALFKLDPNQLTEVLSQLSGETVDLLLSGLLNIGDRELVAAKLAEVIAVLPPEMLADLGTAPRFIPLYLSTTDRTLAGIPVADIQVEGQAALDPRLFVGVGVKRFGSLKPELLNDQIQPIRGVGAKQLELVGVSKQLRFGDQVGLMVYGFHPQYAASFSKLPSRVRVTGNVQLPLQ